MSSDSAPPPHALAQRFRRALSRPGAEARAAEAERLSTALFEEAYGGVPDESAVRWGYAAVVAEHTHYFPGFGLLVRVPWAVAAGARRAGAARLVVAGPSGPLLERLDAALQSRLPLSEAPVEVALLVAEGPGGEEALLGAAAAALLAARAPDLAAEDAAGLAAQSVQEVLGRPCGPAYVLASELGEPVALVDCATAEAVPVELPEDVGFGLLEWREPSAGRPSPAVFWERAALVESALERLRAGGMPELASLRRLEHRDLPAALEGLSGAERAFVRHLATEDRRVPRLVAALRRGDGHMLGALLLMSQASRREDARDTSEIAAFAVALAEEEEGVYGARMAGTGGRVLYVGRSFLLLDFLDRAAAAVAERFGEPPTPVLL